MYKYLLYSIIMFLVHSSLAFAYDNKKTHPSLTEEAINNAIKSEAVLIEQLGFLEGYGQELNNGSETQKIKDWLKDGSTEEDEPNCRAANHFHDPLKPWEESQLTDSIAAIDAICEETTEFYIKYSNISWATGIKNKDGELMSENINGTGTDAVDGRNWFVAREFYYQALTETNPELRELFFAETFHTLGYVLHLLEDMAVPAHTRNDFSEGHFQNIHCPDNRWFCGKEWIGNPYEGYVRDNFDAIYAAIANEGQSQSVSYTGEKKLTNFWDTDIFIPGALPTTSTTQGLAEYTNSNFLSYASIFKTENDDPAHYYQYPDINSLELNEDASEVDFVLLTELAQDGKYDKCLYLRKRRHGETVDRFLTRRYFVPVEENADYGSLPMYDDIRLGFFLNEPCFEDYAKKLLPRAIGYAAGLLDYFFRGKLEVVGLPLFIASSDDKGVFLEVKNVMPDEESLNNGKFSLVMEYPNSSYNPADPGSPEKLYARGYLTPALVQTDFSVDQLANGEKMELLFYFPSDIELPDDVRTLEFYIAYKGGMGSEVDGVIGKKFHPQAMERFAEPWDILEGNYPWQHRHGTADENNGWDTTTVSLGPPTVLVKDNVRYQYFGGARYNETFLDAREQKIIITPYTYLEFKIDALSINQQPPPHENGSPAFQIMVLYFSNGSGVEDPDRSGIEISHAGQAVGLPGVQAYDFTDGVVHLYSIYDLLGITTSAPIYLDQIRFVQQFTDWLSNSVQYEQHLEVDSVRILEIYNDENNAAASINREKAALITSEIRPLYPSLMVK